MTLSDRDIWCIINALRVAAEQYEADALAHSNAPPEAILPQPQRDRIVATFKLQAREVKQLAVMFERADAVKVTGGNK
ncbi:MAG TPA: hypothetical protein VKE42_12285 [Candidatus Cybelea sp.]|nr:hypothetical protein [Candidatus Cybelea sp.]